MSSGYSVYLPGSIVENDKILYLDLFSWNGEKYSKLSRSKSYFVPFMV